MSNLKYIKLYFGGVYSHTVEAKDYPEILADLLKRFPPSQEEQDSDTVEVHYEKPLNLDKKDD